MLQRGYEEDIWKLCPVREWKTLPCICGSHQVFPCIITEVPQILGAAFQNTQRTAAGLLSTVSGPLDGVLGTNSLGTGSQTLGNLFITFQYGLAILCFSVLFLDCNNFQMQGKDIMPLTNVFFSSSKGIYYRPWYIKKNDDEHIGEKFTVLH